MKIELKHGEDVVSNADYARWKCATDEPHTLEEWTEFAMEEYSSNRVKIIADGRNVFEVCRGTIETYLAEEWLYDLFDIYEFSNSWGQRVLYLKHYTGERVFSKEEIDNIRKLANIPFPKDAPEVKYEDFIIAMKG